MVRTNGTSRTSHTARASEAKKSADVIRLRRSHTTVARDAFQSGSSGNTCAPADTRLRAIASSTGAAGPRRGLNAVPADGTTPSEPTRTAEQAFLAKDGAKKTKAAERMLRRAGFRPGNVDARLTENSRTALSQFQAAAGLPATGELDRATFNQLKAVDRRMTRHKGAMGPGQRSSKILLAEKRLRRLGYDAGKVDGVFDARTASATRAFKDDQDELKSESGLLGKTAQRSLERESKAFNHDPYRSRVKNTKAHRRADARTTTAATREHADGSVGMSRGSRGPSVAHVQRHLRSAGFDPQRYDGRFDERTEGALKRFQNAAGLEPTGVVNGRTWQKLRRAQMESRSATDPTQRVGERSDAVRRTEKMLKKLGLNPGAVDGVYTERTQRAVDRFRRREDLGSVGGGVSARVLKKLRAEVANDGLGPARTVTGYTNGVPKKIKVVKVEGYLVELRTAKAYLKMKKAAKRDGVHLQLNSGWRSMEKQRYLYNGWVNRLPGFNPAAPPGYSNHQNGLALDLNTQGVSQSQGTGRVYNWLANNAHRFGFGRIALEHWHWEYRR